MSDQMIRHEHAALVGQVASIRTDPHRILYGGRIITEDAIIATRSGNQGLRLYDDLARDPTVAAALAKRRDGLIGREWTVHPGDQSVAAAEAAALVTRALAAISFNQAVEKALDALLKGISILEVMWRISGDQVLPAALLQCDPLRFAFRPPAQGQEAEAVELRLLTRDAPMDGVSVHPTKFITHRHGGLYENPWGMGIGNRLFWPVWFKRQGIGFWLGALEKFGQPTAIGRYPAGTPEPEQERLLSALQAVATEACVIVPEGMAVELLEAKRAGTFDTYERLARYMDEAITTAILGETLTTSAGASGSRALGEVHNGIRLELVKADADRLSDTLNRSLVRWIVAYNQPGYRAGGIPYPKLWWDVTKPRADLARAERDVEIHGLGFRPSPAYIAATYGPGWVQDGGREA